MISAHDLLRSEAEAQGRDLEQRHLGRRAGAEDVEVVQARERAALPFAEPRQDGDLLVAVAQTAEPDAGQRIGGSGNFPVRYSGEARAVRFDLQGDPGRLAAPVVADSVGDGDVAEDGLRSTREIPERLDVVAGDAYLERVVDRLSGLQLANVDQRARHLRRERALERSDEVGGVVIVRHLDDELRVVDLVLLRREREPESGRAAADEGGHRAEHLAMRLLSVLRGHLAHDTVGDARGLVGRFQRGVLGIRKRYLLASSYRREHGREGCRAVHDLRRRTGKVGFHGLLCELDLGQFRYDLLGPGNH